MRFILIVLLIPIIAFAQKNNGNENVSDSIFITTYKTSSGTFVTERSYNSSKESPLNEKVDYYEKTIKTSDGGTATFIVNRSDIAHQFENNESPTEIVITISPNPIFQKANINIENAEFDFENTVFIIYDLFGREIKKQKVTENDFIFNREGFSCGIYFYVIKDYDTWITGKFIISDQ